MRVPAVLLLLTVVTLAGCTSSSGDSDGDGLDDADERFGWTIEVYTMSEKIIKDVTSDPEQNDTDGDGVPDVYERAFQLDPRNADTDQDGLTDCQEIRHTIREECEDPDFRGPTDGGYGTVANLADSDASASQYVNDNRDRYPAHPARDGRVLRGDGISDGDEVFGFDVTLPTGQRRVTTDPLLVDTDGDFLDDGEERFEWGTDPLTKDTDGDGCEDGFDLFPLEDERFDIGLQTFSWDAEGESGDISVRFLMSIVDRVVTVGGPDGVKVRHSEMHAFEADDAQGVRVLQCSYGVYDRWVRIDIQAAAYRDGQYIGPLDIHSETLPAGISVWWNPVDGGFRWTLDGDLLTVDSAMTWSGVDGSVTFEPRVLFL